MVPKDPPDPPLSDQDGGTDTIPSKEPVRVYVLSQEDSNPLAVILYDDGDQDVVETIQKFLCFAVDEGWSLVRER